MVEFRHFLDGPGRAEGASVDSQQGGRYLTAQCWLPGVLGMERGGGHVQGAHVSMGEAVRVG